MEIMKPTRQFDFDLRYRYGEHPSNYSLKNYHPNKASGQIHGRIDRRTYRWTNPVVSPPKKSVERPKEKSQCLHFDPRGPVQGMQVHTLANAQQRKRCWQKIMSQQSCTFTLGQSIWHTIQNRQLTIIFAAVFHLLHRLQKLLQCCCNKQLINCLPGIIHVHEKRNHRNQISLQVNISKMDMN